MPLNHTPVAVVCLTLSVTVQLEGDKEKDTLLHRWYQVSKQKAMVMTSYLYRLTSLEAVSAASSHLPNPEQARV